MAPAQPTTAVKHSPLPAEPPDVAPRNAPAWRTLAGRAICAASFSVLTCGLALAAMGRWDPQPVLVAVGSPMAWAGLAGVLLGLALSTSEHRSARPAEHGSARATTTADGSGAPARSHAAQPHPAELAHSSRTLYERSTFR